MQDFIVFEYFAIDSSYLRLFQIDLVAGRNLTLRDSNAFVLVNKTLCKNLQLDTAEEALGKEIKMGGGERFTIAGVVDEFYSNSLKEGFDYASGCRRGIWKNLECNVSGIRLQLRFSR